MPSRTLAQEILGLLDQAADGAPPITISHFARSFGVSSALTRLCAKQLVAEGSADAFMITNGGIVTIQGLTRRTAAPAKVAAKRKRAVAAAPGPAATIDHADLAVAGEDLPAPDGAVAAHSAP